MKRIDREDTMALAISAIIDAADSYGESYKILLDSQIGDDAILGDDGVREILRGARVLLNGPTGHFNCGRLDARILDVAARHGLLDDNGEL